MPQPTKIQIINAYQAVGVRSVLNVGLAASSHQKYRRCNSTTYDVLYDVLKAGCIQKIEY
jgi:hypothetical protein